MARAAAEIAAIPILPNRRRGVDSVSSEGSPEMYAKSAASARFSRSDQAASDAPTFSEPWLREGVSAKLSNSALVRASAGAEATCRLAFKYHDNPRGSSAASGGSVGPARSSTDAAVGSKSLTGLISMGATGLTVLGRSDSVTY